MQPCNSRRADFPFSTKAKKHLVDPHAPSHLGLVVALTNSDGCDDRGHKEREENAAGNRKTLLAARQLALTPMAQNLEEKERMIKRSPEKPPELHFP